MVQLGLFQPLLPILTAEKLEHLIEDLLRIVEHVGERPALPVGEKVLAPTVGSLGFRRLFSPMTHRRFYGGANSVSA